MADQRSEAAAKAVAYLEEVSPELRGCAVLDAAAAGVLAASGDDPDAWLEPSLRFVAAADSAGDEGVAARAHVATEDGECFVVREGGLIAVAVTERFVLSSLTFFDMRAALRDAAAAGA